MAFDADYIELLAEPGLAAEVAGHRIRTVKERTIKKLLPALCLDF